MLTVTDHTNILSPVSRNLLPTHLVKWLFRKSHPHIIIQHEQFTINLQVSLLPRLVSWTLI